MSKLDPCIATQPELVSEFEAIKEETRRTNTLTLEIVNKLNLLKQFNAIEPTSEQKSTNDFIGALRNERLYISSTNDILQRCFNHLSEIL